MFGLWFWSPYPLRHLDQLKSTKHRFETAEFFCPRMKKWKVRQGLPRSGNFALAFYSYRVAHFPNSWILWISLKLWIWLAYFKCRGQSWSAGARTFPGSTGAELERAVGSATQISCLWVTPLCFQPEGPVSYQCSKATSTARISR